MAIISANVQYNRGEHKLLDYSSLQADYAAAMIWAKDENSNAAVGQFIYIEGAYTDPETDKTYAKGPYVVDAIGENAILTPLSKGSAGDIEITDVVNNIKTDVAGLKTSVGAINSSIENIGTDITGIKEDIAGLGEDLANIEIPVKDVTFGGASIVDVNGNAVLDDTLANYVTSDAADNKYLAKTDAENTYATKTSVYTTEQVDAKVSAAINALDPAAVVETGKYVSGISLVDGKLEVSKADLPEAPAVPVYGITKTGDLEYTLTMDGSPVDGAVINIPADMVVSSGEVVELADGDVEGKAAGTYIKLVLNNGAVLYINTTELVDVYTGEGYIDVTGYSISLDYEALKTQMISDLNDVYEAKGVAKDLADNAKDAAISAAADAVDVKLADYYTSTEVDNKVSSSLENYYTKELVDNAVDAVKATANKNASRLDTLEGIVVGGEGEGIEAILNDVASLKAIVGTPETSAEEATGMVKDVIDLKAATDDLSANAIKSIVVGTVPATVSDNTATISLVDNLSNVSDDKKVLPVSTGAVISVVDNLSNAIAGKSQISLVDSMPESLDSNTIYLHRDGDKIVEKVVVDGDVHIIGSDLYASKDLATSSSAGLMSADDKARFDAMVAISVEELKGLGIN